MACSGCAQRRAALTAALKAVARGDGDEVRRQLSTVTNSASEDIDRARAAARARLQRVTGQRG